MKELDKMTDEELNAIAAKIDKEKQRRAELIKKEYNDRYNALCEITKAFKNYCDKFNGELPYMCMKEVNNKPIQVNMIVSHDKADEHPYLFFYRR